MVLLSASTQASSPTLDGSICHFSYGEVKVMAPKVAYAASSVLCITHRASVQPMSQPKPTLIDCGLQPYSCTRP